MWTGAVLLAVVSQRYSVDTSGRNRVGGLVMRVAYLRSTITLGLALLFSFSADAQNWRQVGPPGGDVESLAAAPGSARTLFLGTSDGHVFGSHDAGEHWELLGRIGEHS